MRDLWSLGTLPVLAVGMVAALIGVYWDIAWHIDKGRDSFFTPPHNFIYGAILAVLFTSLYGLWRDHRLTPLHLRLGNYRFHAGTLIVSVAASVILLFAPLDELWHQLFGADVTLWAPMHLIGLVGLLMANFGGLVSSWLEHHLANRKERKRRFTLLTLFFSATLLTFMTLLLAEYAFNVAAYPLILDPLLLASLSSFVLVLIARLMPQPWSATITTLLFTLIRFAVALWLMTTASFDLAGETRPFIPLLVTSGLMVDLLLRWNWPAWVVGMVGGIITLYLNFGVISMVGGVVWYPDVVQSAIWPTALLSSIMGYLADQTAQRLTFKRQEVVA